MWLVPGDTVQLKGLTADAAILDRNEVWVLHACRVYCQQAFFLRGLQLTSVIFSSIVLNCIPVWTLLVAVVFRWVNHSFRVLKSPYPALLLRKCMVQDRRGFIQEERRTSQSAGHPILLFRGNCVDSIQGPCRIRRSSTCWSFARVGNWFMATWCTLLFWL